MSSQHIDRGHLGRVAGGTMPSGYLDRGDHTMSSGYLDRGDHTVYWEAEGAEGGVPVLVLHGGWGPLDHDGQYLDLTRSDHSG